MRAVLQLAVSGNGEPRNRTIKFLEMKQVADVERASSLGERRAYSEDGDWEMAWKGVSFWTPARSMLG